MINWVTSSDWIAQLKVIHLEYLILRTGRLHNLEIIPKDFILVFYNETKLELFHLSITKHK